MKDATNREAEEVPVRGSIFWAVRERMTIAPGRHACDHLAPTVTRLFRDDAVPHPDGSIDPLRDVATFETEFILSDMAVLESRVEKIHKQIGRAHDDQMKKELPVLEKCLALLHDERPLRNEDLADKPEPLIAYWIVPPLRDAALRGVSHPFDHCSVAQ